MPNKILIPTAILDRVVKEDAQTRAADIKQLARHILLNSYASGNPVCRVSPEEAFSRAFAFHDTQAELFPKYETSTGDAKGVLHGE